MAFSAEMRAVREDQHEAQDPKPLLMNVAAFAIALFAGVAATAYVLRGSAQSTHGLQSSTLSSSAIAPALQINSENKYSLRDGKPFLQYYKWLEGSQVLEPYMDSTLSVLNPADGASYEWIIDGTQLTATDATVSHTCEKPGTLSITVLERVGSSGVSRAYEGTWYCKYIRREIRALFDEDREGFFSAAEVLYKIPQSVGERKFGSNFLCMDKLVFMHNNLAGRMDCDHAHDGKGFVVAHAAMTNVFERSLQAVDPSVTLPYWDFTIEGSRVAEHEFDLGYWFRSEVFQDDWFGEANPPNHVVTKGRWAYTRVRADTRDNEVHNAYGFVRAPWNANNIPYVTRCNTMLGYQFDYVPTCSEHLAILEKTSWATFAEKIAFGPHALVHALIGGMWGADWASLFSDFNYSYSKGFNVALQGFSLQKNLWRLGFYVCPTSCSVNDDIDKCKCTCPALSDIKDDHRAITSLLMQISIFQDSSYFYSDDENWVGYEILRVICNDFPGVAGILGDQLESASPADISFWPIHPTLERLWQWKRLNGGFEDSSWNEDASSCTGHNPGDNSPFINLFDGQTHFITNMEVVEYLDPTKDTLPYIYDSFEWPHCASMDIPLHLIY